MLQVVRQSRNCEIIEYVKGSSLENHDIICQMQANCDDKEEWWLRVGTRRALIQTHASSKAKKAEKHLSHLENYGMALIKTSL